MVATVNQLLNVHNVHHSSIELIICHRVLNQTALITVANPTLISSSATCAPTPSQSPMNYYPLPPSIRQRGTTRSAHDDESKRRAGQAV
jgi:hypothetical protein